MIVTTAVLAISVFATLLAFGLFLRVHKEHTPANYLLMCWLGIICIFVIMLFLIRTGLILNVPWLYRLPSPLYYLTFPAAWLYVRMVLKDETRLRKTDLLHALPALLHLVEMLPYYFSSYDHKLAVVTADLANPLGGFRLGEGWMPNYVHNILRSIQTIAYAIPMALLIRKYFKDHKIQAAAFAKPLQWLKTIAAGQFAFGISTLVLLGYGQLGTADFRSFLLYVLLASYCTLWATYLVLHPSILRGMPRLSIPPMGLPDNIAPMPAQNFEVPDLQPVQSASKTVSDEFQPAEPSQPSAVGEPASLPLSEEYLVYSRRLQQFMDQKKPYLEARYSMSRLAMDLQIPKHHLTYLLNQVMHTRFTDYINQQRISYLQQQIAKGALESHTLEALALEAGFNSRITFIRAVKRATGQNPSGFFKTGTVNQNT
jgi:AraC-like DNA-binding protein